MHFLVIKSNGNISHRIQNVQVRIPPVSKSKAICKELVNSFRIHHQSEVIFSILMVFINMNH